MKHINTIRRAMALVAVMVVTMATVIAQTAVKYIDKDGKEQPCETYTVVEATTTAWNTGWYLVNSEVVILGGVTVTGEVHLILADGASLTVTGAAGKAGINVNGTDNSLTIYGQAGGTGQLTANGMGYANGTGGAGIGGNDMQSGGNITVNGGIVTANGGGGGAGIGGGCDGTAYNIEINRGTVTANGSLLSTGIGVGATTETGEWIDFNDPAMGVSGLLKWAKKNVGATNGTTKDSWYGNYYAWGETTTKQNYSESTYTYKENPSVLDNAHDAAYQNAQPVETWHMPTGGEWKQLKDNTYFQWTENYNGVSDLKGYIVYKVKSESDKGVLNTAPSNKIYTTADPHLFLPTVGFRTGTNLYDVSSNGNYWSSSLYSSYPNHAYYVSFNPGGVNPQSHYFWYCGFTVRPVRNSPNPNSTTTLTINNSDNTAAKALGVAWKEGDVVNVYNVNEQVGEFSYRYNEGGNAIFKGYIDEGIEADKPLMFRKGTPTYTGQDGKIETLKANYCLEGKATYNTAGNYTVNMGTPYALMKLYLSAFGTETSGTTVTIKAGSPSETVASVTGVTTSSNELYVMLPTENASGAENPTEVTYTFESGTKTGVMTWAIKQNTFKDDGAGGAIVVEAVMRTVNFGTPNLNWAVCNLGATNGTTAESWYGGYYAWGETSIKSDYSWATYTHCNGNSD